MKKMSKMIHPGQRELNPDEFAARVALFVEPVGEDEPRYVIVRIGANPLKEALGI